MMVEEPLKVRQNLINVMAIVFKAWELDFLKAYMIERTH
jgi:hypothetical protein